MDDRCRGTGTGKKTPGGAGTHTGQTSRSIGCCVCRVNVHTRDTHTGHAGAHQVRHRGAVTHTGHTTLYGSPRWEPVQVERYRGDGTHTGHTRDTRFTQTNLTTIQTHLPPIVLYIYMYRFHVPKMTSNSQSVSKSVLSRSPRAHHTTVSKDGSAPLGQHPTQLQSMSSSIVNTQRAPDRPVGRTRAHARALPEAYCTVQ
jgi:hypothetical protein